MTEQQQQQHANGNGHEHRFMDNNFDPDDPEYIRQLQRPADVSEDLQEMKRRERVTMVLKSQAFRDELETIIQDALKAGCNPTSLLALQQISELVLPQNRFNQAGLLNSARGPRGTPDKYAKINPKNSFKKSKLPFAATFLLVKTDSRD